MRWFDPDSWRSCVLALVLAISSCVQKPPPPKFVAAPHYFLGAPYEADGHWYYPAEDFSLDEKGLATVQDRALGLTKDGELIDPDALTGAMQTIQLPVIVDVTNLENGRRIMVRVNDRGPASPARLIALSPRAAQLLQIPPGGAARVHVQIEDMLTRRLEDQLGGGPKLQIASAAPRIVTAEALPPIGGGPLGPAHVIGAQSDAPEAPPVPDRLPETVRMTYADPGILVLRCGSFGRFDYAHIVASKLYGIGARVVRSREGRQSSFAVEAGPFATIAQADAALARALAQGVVDARIDIE